MGYTEKLLSTNEKILFRTRKHFFVIFGQLIKEIVILVVLAIGVVAVHQTGLQQKLLFDTAFGVVAVVVLGSMLIDVLRWRTEEFLVTNRRVIQSTGIFNKNVIDSSLNKINDVVLQQSWLGRMFGYGTIKILTATEDVINLLDRISNPIGFKHAMLNAKAEMEPIAAPVGASSASATQLLEELAQLKSRNIISEAEYEEKRKEILKRM